MVCMLHLSAVFGCSPCNTTFSLCRRISNQCREWVAKGADFKKARAVEAVNFTKAFGTDLSTGKMPGLWQVYGEIGRVGICTKQQADLLMAAGTLEELASNPARLINAWQQLRASPAAASTGATAAAATPAPAVRHSEQVQVRMERSASSLSALLLLLPDQVACCCCCL